MATIALGGLMIPSYGVDDDGVQWRVTKVGGWFDGLDSTGTVTQRAAADGGWLSPAYRAPRLVELEGTVAGGSQAANRAAVARLAAAIPLSGLTPLVITTEDGARRALVRQSGRLLASLDNGLVAPWSVSLIAPDPRRYATSLIEISTGLPSTEGGLSLPVTLPVTIGAEVVSGSLTAANDGDLPTDPVFTLTGPVPAGARITLAGSGASLLVPDAVAAGRTLVIDTGEQTAVLDGVAARRVVGTWFSLPPGESTVLFSAPVYDAGSLLTLTYRSAWR